MSMLMTVLSNLCRPSRTRGPADTPPTPAAFRGMLRHDVSLCTGCGTCAHVCSPKAITLREQPGVSVTWQFYAGQCSFCGLCRQFCPTGAIGFDATPPEVTGENTAHRLESAIAYVPCSCCGKPHIPMPEQTAALLPGTSAAEAALCQECRRKSASERIRLGMIGAPAQPARSSCHDK